MSTITIEASLLPWQRKVREEAARFNVVDIGRQSGKSYMSHILVAETATTGYPAAYLAPTYKALGDVWDSLVDNLRRFAKRVDGSDNKIELVGGGSVELWSMESVNRVRGRQYRRIVVDEAAHAPGLMRAWTLVLRPTLAQLHGDAWFPSTPCGLNDFYTMYKWGQDPLKPDWRSWMMPSSVGTLSDAEIEDMRLGMPERAFQQEIMAQFLEDGGAVFRGVRSAVTDDGYATTNEHTYIFGVDWAKSEDYNVVCVVDATDRRVVEMDRSNKVDYALQVKRLAVLADRYKPASIIAERNAMGEPIIEQLQRENLPVRGFTTTNASKAEAIEALALAFERGDIRIPPDDVLIGELEAYTMERLPSGMLRYSAPEGMHDDTVMALALAWSGARGYTEGSLMA